MKLVALDPRFFKRNESLLTTREYETTDDIDGADGIMMQCPACTWSMNRHGGLGRGGLHQRVHDVMLWIEPKQFSFTGTSYHDLSIKSGNHLVYFTVGCKSRFICKEGKVDFA